MRWVFICLLVPFVHLFILVSFLSMKMGPQHYLSFVILKCVIITDRRIVQRSSVRITFFSSFTSTFFFFLAERKACDGPHAPRIADKEDGGIEAKEHGTKLWLCIRCSCPNARICNSQDQK